MGRELFDFALKEFSQRWMFKRPTPADFFRTMEEASGVDLDWFWHGWFYTTDHVDISIDKVYKLRLDTEDPDIDFERQRQFEQDKPTSLFVERNREQGRKLWVEMNRDVKDFYDDNDRFTVTNKERNKYQQFLADMSDIDRQTLLRAVKEDKNYYVVDFSNVGGLVMPILLEVTYADDSKELMHFPAETWRRAPHNVSKLIVTEREIKSLLLDPKWETADVDIENNYYPRRIIPSRIESFKEKDKGMEYRDIMQDIKTKAKAAKQKQRKK